MRDPERTRRVLLDEARKEFSAKGFAGARMDCIARQAGINKQALYYHYGSKEDLFREALESGYRKFRERDRKLDIHAKSPADALTEVIAATFHDVEESPELVAMIIEENRLLGEHLNPEHIRAINIPLMDSIAEILTRGANDGSFRKGVDPEHFYISLLSLVMFYFSNVYTLSAVLGRDLHSPTALAERVVHITDLLVSSLRP